jgi:hypothetical protein
MVVKRNNSLETPSAILRTEKYPCATIAIREDTSNKRVVPNLPIRKVERRNTVKTPITVERARTIGRIAKQPKRDDSDGSYYQIQGKKRGNNDEHGMGKPGDDKFSGCFGCGSKDHRKSDCPKNKKTTHWKDSVNMLGFFLEDKEEVNSLSESYREREQVFIDSCASKGIFIVSESGEIYLQRVEELREPIILGLTDKNESLQSGELQ